jgi:Flp pilus assembly pilin Flp
MDKVNEILLAGITAAQRALARPRLHSGQPEEGQALVEYALILALVAVAALVAFKLLQPAIIDTFNRVTTTLTTSSTPIPTTPTP